MSKLDVTSKRVAATGTLHLKDAEDNLLFAPDEGGKLTIPVTVDIFGPGSREHAAASAKRSTRQLERLRKKGKVTINADESLSEDAEFLADITSHFSESFSYRAAEGKTGRDFALAVYSDRELGFFAEQVAEYSREWGNFTKSSAKS